MKVSDELAKSLLQFLSSLFWQLIVAGVLVGFRKEVKDLIRRLTKITAGPAAFEIGQEASAQAERAPVEAVLKRAGAVGANGFFTREGILELVTEHARNVVPKDEAIGAIMIFDIRTQRTWLVATRERLYLVLDDNDTRVSGAMIQWHMPLSSAHPVRVRSDRGTLGGHVDIGERRDWLYSSNLYPNASDLERDISDLIANAKTRRKPR
ncbi:hypothetical protein EON82_14755 [bacterium]|nr:MAG: hypothetical protein EON82_14755 [bacterium]